MTISKVACGTKTNPSQVDWIICFAIIKLRNPSLWARGRTGQAHITTRHRNDNIYSLIPDGLAHIKANKPLLTQLDVVYQYILRFKKLSINLNIIESLSEDINAQEMTKWVLPHYNSVITILSVAGKVHHQKALSRLNVCFQLLLSSYCCCKLQDPCKFVFENLVVKFIRKDVMINKTKKTKIIQRFNPKEGISIRKSKLLKLHCKLLVLIFNLKLRIATTSTKKDKPDAVHFFRMIGDYCMYLESLIHAFIAQLSFNGSAAHQKDLAFNQHYLARTKTLPDKYVKDILLIVSENNSQPHERMKLLRMVIKDLLRVLDSIMWSLLNDYAEQHKAAINTLARQRMNVQSTLLAAGDLELTSEFRLISWPSWLTDF